MATGLLQLAGEGAQDTEQHRQSPCSGPGVGLAFADPDERCEPATEVTATSEIVDTGEIMVFAGPRFANVVWHGSAKGLTGVRRDLEANPELLVVGPTAVLHVMADHVVHGYLTVADTFERDVEELEAAVFSAGRTDDAGRIYQLKRELLEFKRAVVPLGQPLQRLSETGVSAGLIQSLADHVDAQVTAV